MVLVVDNFDSFAWNLVHAAGTVRPDLPIMIRRCDRIDAAGAEGLSPTHIIISPGPCGPAAAGSSVPIIRALAGRVPILGVCLGHQCIAAAFGMAVVRACGPLHGRTSMIRHDGRGVFEGIESPMEAMRYHSLTVDAGTVDTSAWTLSATLDEDGPPMVMGLRRRWDRAPLEGVQFHPESFATTQGERLIANFLRSRGPVRCGTMPGTSKRRQPA